MPEQHPGMSSDETRRHPAMLPVSACIAVSDDAGRPHTMVAWRVPVGRDGGARVARQLLQNAGITDDRVEATSPRTVLPAALSPATTSSVHRRRTCRYASVASTLKRKRAFA